MMNQETINAINRVVAEYAAMKRPLIQQIMDLRIKYDANPLMQYQLDIEEDALWLQITGSQERAAFVKAAAKCREDAEFEKYFRAAHSKEFLNKSLDPE